ncbi:MAG: PD-(D/E)XK nuclease family protein [Deltaproteobacteria bacterium]|nr:PD-(D/E)XK nuclease family protein [Deltaproteobacteria bacterium]
MDNRKKRVSSEEVESFILTAFEENFARLRYENGHGLTAEVKEAARRQVLLYWRKLREIAETVTDTEVRLNLPGQKTPKRRKFNIEGIVDIVRTQERTVMYDLKTLDPDYLKKYLPEYERQLNIYAHIWMNLRGQSLDETAIIATRFPRSLDEAYERREEHPAALEAEIERWQPVIPVPFDAQHIEETIRDFGKVVDSIEDGDFSPPPVKRLKQKEVGSGVFATYVCRNCDARFSCESYREYIRTTVRPDLPRYREMFDDMGPEEDLQDRLDEALG